MSAFANGPASPTANGGANVAAVLSNLFPSLISPDNEKRKQAEAAYEQLKTSNPVGVVREITRALLAENTQPQILDLAAVLLKTAWIFSSVLKFRRKLKLK